MILVWSDELQGFEVHAFVATIGRGQTPGSPEVPPAPFHNPADANPSGDSEISPEEILPLKPHSAWLPPALRLKVG